MTALTTFLFFDIIGPDSTCQHPSVKTYSGNTASKVFSHMHTCSVSPSCLTLHSGSCVPLGISLVIHLFKALWFMSAFRGRQKCTHFHLLCLPVASYAAAVIGQVFFSANGDGLPTGAHFICQSWWIITRLTVSNRRVFSLLFIAHNIWTTVYLSKRAIYYCFRSVIHK